MNDKELQAEIEGSLTRAFTTYLQMRRVQTTCIQIEDVYSLLRSSAESLARRLAARVLTDEQLDSLAVLACCSCPLCSEIKRA